MGKKGSSDRTEQVGCLYYFAYGSNMSERRLKARIASASLICAAQLTGYRFAIQRSGAACGSGKCNIVKTGNTDDLVYGVAYRIDQREQALLDEIEGGHGYGGRLVRVQTEAGAVLEVLTYLAVGHSLFAKPYHWYKAHVLRGAEENRLPPAYLKIIREVVSIDDPDIENHERELSIYR